MASTKKSSKKKGKRSNPADVINTPENATVALSIANTTRNRVGSAFTQEQWIDVFQGDREREIVEGEFTYAMTLLHFFKLVLIDKIDGTTAYYRIEISDEQEVKLLNSAIEELDAVIKQATEKRTELQEKLKKYK